ncbi:hypothetical protein B0H19DRAFT_1087836 [Mycena capillaripes]|nr:hypothetical protein B0H19DRAFT_1087836 [Mycena capillaripes]
MPMQSSSENVDGSLLGSEIRLPPELLLEISSWLLNRPSSLIAEREERIAEIRAYRALSQTCRLFRGVFLPHLWSHLDAIFSEAKDLYSEPLELEWERRMRQITQAQYLLDHVKTISLSLHGPAFKTPERSDLFVTLLCACPNLDALKIMSLRIDRPASNILGMFDHLYTAFRPHSLPSVRMVILPDILSPILSSFPRVRSLTCGEDSPTAGFRLMQAAKNHCPHLEEVCYGGSSRVMLGWIAGATPNIRRLILRNTLFPDDFEKFMRGLTNLRYLEFAHREDDKGTYLSLEDCATAARELLGVSRNPEPKKICIKSLRGMTGIVLKVTVIELP